MCRRGKWQNVTGVAWILYEAILLADRVYFFDNSASSAKLLATVENGELSFVEGVEYMPGWFKRYVIDKLA